MTHEHLYSGLGPFSKFDNRTYEFLEIVRSLKKKKKVLFQYGKSGRTGPTRDMTYTNPLPSPNSRHLLVT